MAKKSPTGSPPPAVPLAITPTSRRWTHTSDDSCFYQLSLVLATATFVSLILLAKDGDMGKMADLEDRLALVLT